MDKYNITGMSCAACQAHVEKAVSKVPGVESVSVSLLTNSMGVEGSASSEAIVKAVEDAGYGAAVQGAEESQSSANSLEAQEKALEDKESPILKRRLVTSVVFLLVLMYFSMGHTMFHLPLPKFLDGNHIGITVIQMVLAAIVMFINKKFFVSGWKSVRSGAPSMDTLVAMGSMTSFLWSFYILMQMTRSVTDGDTKAVMAGMHNLYFESAAMIVTLITVGKLLEALSKGRTTDALKSLMKLAPKTAVIERDGEETLVQITEVKTGDVFVVRPGESIPVDGVIIEGGTAIDESALTGESVPVDKSIGDEVSAATINRTGFIRAKATRVGEDTTLSQIIKMVSDAAATKAPIAKIADKVSGIFVPIVIIIAVIVTLIWIFVGQPFGYALARGIAVLVVSCPCALGLATPVAIMVGSGLGAKNGILFKTASSLEETGRIQIVALDKTGTITKGEPTVTDIKPADGVTAVQLLNIANALEARSEHPFALAITRYFEEKREELKLADVEIEAFEAISGKGIQAKLVGAESKGDLYAGSVKYISALVEVADDIKTEADSLAALGKTPLLFAGGGKLIGMIAVADTVKDDSRSAIAEMKRQGLKVVMITGDNERTARAIGDQAGVEYVASGVLPDGKENLIRELGKLGKVAMVGDGINDAPALTRADVGIAIGAGADVAVDAADVVLMNSRLSDVSGAIRLSRATLRNIHENLFWAFFYNILLIPLAAGAYVHFMKGWSMNPMWGAAAMSLSSFCVCMNALRLNLFKVHNANRDRHGKGEVSETKLNSLIAKVTGNEESSEEPGQNETNNLHEDNLKEGKVMTKTMKIEGMMCGHCEATVKKALEAIEGVNSAEVSHEAGTAVVELSEEVQDEVLQKAVEDKDYKVLSIA
ncbi:MAG: heavy metal translocating P-type ATPase [Mogibacterium diversum]|uniref:heavy metal translocating P-type ATPase n=1 Tax=Mogibacterium diversum TaxID=114527 RepID=UPI00205EB8EE|nr:heavy metal translocating P-type ATPase [Mogibacterium diversum]UQF81598.1 MAG: heavy metal translocating P-type ATPase [Mogibacterium diversum]